MGKGGGKRGAGRRRERGQGEVSYSREEERGASRRKGWVGETGCATDSEGARGLAGVSALILPNHIRLPVWSGLVTARSGG